MGTGDGNGRQLRVDELSLIEQRVANEGPSMALAYVFWFLLWFVSAHRFYLRKPWTAVLQIASYFVLIGFVWLIVDAFLIPGMVRERRQAIRDEFGGMLSSRE